MVRPAWLLLAAAAFVIGCNSEGGAGAVRPPTPGGLLQVVNLTSETLEFQLNDAPPNRVQPGRSSGFMLTRPNRVTTVNFLGVDLDPVDVSVESERTHSVYVFSQGGSLQTVRIDDDPNDASDSTVALRLVDVRGRNLTLRMEDGTTAAAGETVSIKPGSQLLQVVAGGSNLGQIQGSFEAKQAWTLIAPWEEGGSPVLLHTNPPMQAVPMGASPAGG